METVEQKQTFIKFLIEKVDLTMFELMDLKTLKENLTEYEKSQLDKASLNYIEEFSRCYY